MKVLQINQMEEINGSGFFSGFCRGVHVVSTVYGAAILVGAVATPAAPAAWTLIGINAACAFA